MDSYKREYIKKGEGNDIFLKPTAKGGGMLYSIQVGAVIFLAVTAFSLAILVCGARVSRKEGDDYSAVGILFKSVLATVAYLSISWMYFSYSGDKTTTFILMVMLLIFPAIWLIAEIKFKDRTDHQVRRVG